MFFVKIIDVFFQSQIATSAIHSGCLKVWLGLFDWVLFDSTASRQICLSAVCGGEYSYVTSERTELRTEYVSWF